MLSTFIFDILWTVSYYVNLRNGWLLGICDGLLSCCKLPLCCSSRLGLLFIFEQVDAESHSSYFGSEMSVPNSVVFAIDPWVDESIWARLFKELRTIGSLSEPAPICPWHKVGDGTMLCAVRVWVDPVLIQTFHHFRYYFSTRKSSVVKKKRK